MVYLMVSSIDLVPAVYWSLLTGLLAISHTADTLGSSTFPGSWLCPLALCMLLLLWLLLFEKYDPRTPLVSDHTATASLTSSTSLCRVSGRSSLHRNNRSWLGPHSARYMYAMSTAATGHSCEPVLPSVMDTPWLKGSVLDCLIITQSMLGFVLSTVMWSKIGSQTSGRSTETIFSKTFQSEDLLQLQNWNQ